MAESFDEAARFADRLVYDGKTAARMRKCQRQHMPQDGAERIAAYIIDNNGRIDREAPRIDPAKSI